MECFERRATIADQADKVVSRRTVVRSLIMGLVVLVGGSWWLSEGNEDIYQLEKDSFKLKPREATVLLSFLLDAAENRSVAGGGVLVDKFNILTSAHLGVHTGFSYTLGQDFVEVNSRQGQVKNGIEKVVTHSNIDLAIAHLVNPQFGSSYPEISSRQLVSGDGPLSLTSVSSLKRVEVYAGKTDRLANLNQFGQRVLTESMVVTANSAASHPGDSGSPLYLENEDKLVGICSGRIASALFFLNPRSYFVNLTNSNVKKWIEENLKH